MTQDEIIEMAIQGHAGTRDAIRWAIKQALAAPVQKPVGTYGEIFESMLFLLRTGMQRDHQIYMAMKDKPLYTAAPAQPAQRQFVGLTFAEICECENDYLHLFARAIEAKLKEKNNG
jgi:hypothetical protein